VIARAADILRALQQNPEGLSLGEIARLVDLPRSTVQRIVDALDNESLVIAASPSGGVRLGPALLPLAAATKFEIADLLHPTLAQLARDTGETVDLAVRDQDKLVFIDHIPGTHRLRAVSAVGVSFPLHCSANGRALLAALPEPELERLRQRLRLTRLTEHTLTSWAELERVLARVRRSGVAYDREEHTLGICAVGTAVRGPTGELAAVSIPVPTPRFAARERELTRKLLEWRQTVPRRL
jgi:DNA-binding IclR family transcriptional regulator